jgi:hypothetical protein
VALVDVWAKDFDMQEGFVDESVHTLLNGRVQVSTQGREMVRWVIE